MLILGDKYQDETQTRLFPISYEYPCVHQRSIKHNPTNQTHNDRITFLDFTVSKQAPSRITTNWCFFWLAMESWALEEVDIEIGMVAGKKKWKVGKVGEPKICNCRIVNNK